MSDTYRFPENFISEVRLDLFLARATGRSRVFVQEQIARGRVAVDGKEVLRAAQKLLGERLVAASFEEEPAATLLPVPFPLEVLYEDAVLLVVNKPQGMVVHPASAHKGPTLVHYLLHYLQGDPQFAQIAPSRPGIVHRLDKGTSGCLVVAKTRPALENLSAQFMCRSVKKEYEALVFGIPPAEGVIETNIGRHPTLKVKMSSIHVGGRAAKTRYETVEALQNAAHVRLFPQTGRTHQLRVHLSDLGHPILGDTTYCGRRRMPVGVSAEYPFLHARSIEFQHPETRAWVEVSAPLPSAFTEAISRLR